MYLYVPLLYIQLIDRDVAETSTSVEYNIDITADGKQYPTSTEQSGWCEEQAAF
jgi:hypothetical protein